MAFGFSHCDTSAFMQSARLYNPKLFAMLNFQPTKVVLMPSPKGWVDQFATNFEEVLGEVEGVREPMRTNADSAVLDTMAASSAA